VLVPQVDSAVLKTGFDGLASANRQLTNDAAGNKALVNTLQVLHYSDRKLLGWRRSPHHALQVAATEFKFRYNAQKADFDQLATDAGDMKAAYDTQQARYDTLQVGSGCG
jgi:hypothetical protein